MALDYGENSKPLKEWLQMDLNAVTDHGDPAVFINGLRKNLIQRAKSPSDDPPDSSSPFTSQPFEIIVAAQEVAVRIQFLIQTVMHSQQAVLQLTSSNRVRQRMQQQQQP